MNSTGFQLCGGAVLILMKHHFVQLTDLLRHVLCALDLRVLLQIGGNSKLSTSGANSKAISHS